jgi:glycosyltransferase involved in cell wall biosynthesis
VNPRPAGPTRRSDTIARTAYVATYPPRRCGIATFTHHLGASTGSREIVALHPVDQVGPYPSEVHHRIRRDELGDYVATAAALTQCVDVASIQHDYSIWGGPDGAHVVDFARALRVPSVVTLHSVPRTPTTDQRAILLDLVGEAAATVVMSRAAATLLTTTYGVDARRVEVIPHGVPNVALADPETMKPGLGLQGRTVLLSFGLLGPGKGYELALDALPEIAAADPTVLYVILGETHPDERAGAGEAYRAGLVEQVRRLKIGNHVQFVDRYVGRVELIRWLEAADVFITPYPDLDRVVSGTLSYAMGAGRAVVSTPYACAVEMLADERGIIVPAGSPAALAAAVIDLLADPERRREMGRRAHGYTRGMIWTTVAAEYTRLFEQVAGERARPVGAIPLAAFGA